MLCLAIAASHAADYVNMRLRLRERAFATFIRDGQRFERSLKLFKHLRRVAH